MKIAYVVVWGQFSDTMWALIERTAEFKKIKQVFDMIRLLKEIKKNLFRHGTVKFSLHALKNATKHLHNIDQSRSATVNEYFEHINNAADVVIYFWR